MLKMNQGCIRGGGVNHVSIFLRHPRTESFELWGAVGKPTADVAGYEQHCLDVLEHENGYAPAAAMMSPDHRRHCGKTGNRGWVNRITGIRT